MFFSGACAFFSAQNVLFSRSQILQNALNNRSVFKVIFANKWIELEDGTLDSKIILLSIVGCGVFSSVLY